MLVKAEATGRHKHEVADIFRIYGEQYRAGHTLTRKQEAVIKAIERCRSSDLGYHIDRCDSCGHVESSYNSCRDRHCPKCQGIDRRRWVQSRLKDLLPLPYYHVVFTLPDAIFPACLFNQKSVYDLLFDSAAETLLTFGRDERWMGGETGFFGILHTWGQTMCLHPHVHFIVAGGGIDDEGRWASGKYQGKFLFPVRALSKVFRGKFIAGLKRAYARDELQFPGESAQKAFEIWIEELCSKQWIVFAKPPFGSPEEVVSYVGRYTHRVVISNHRIVSIEEGQIAFNYKDYRDEGKVKEMTLSAQEFIRRFLWHVLPSGFHKIRHYGFLANGRKKRLQQIIEALKSTQEIPPEYKERVTAEPVRGIVCPLCRKGRLHTIAVITRYGELIIRNLACFIEFVKKKFPEGSPEMGVMFR